MVVPATIAESAPRPGADSARRRSRRGNGLVALSAVIAAVVLLPLLFLLIQAAQVGWSELSSLIFRQLTATLLWNTIRLLVAVSIACAIIGTATAWCIERTNLPGRHVWAVLVVLPVAIPDFVVSYGWVSVAPSVRGFRGAVLVMTLALYPLVYLPVAASLRGADPAMEEVARGLGLGPVATFIRVTLAECRTAILGGSLLVALAALAEYGAFEILGFRTFTTTIFTEFHVGFDAPAACALSLVLVLISLVVLVAEAAARGRTRTNRSIRSSTTRAAAQTARPGHAPDAVRLRRADGRRAGCADRHPRLLDRAGKLEHTAPGVDRERGVAHGDLQRGSRRASRRSSRFRSRSPPCVSAVAHRSCWSAVPTSCRRCRASSSPSRSCSSRCDTRRSSTRLRSSSSPRMRCCSSRSRSSR